MSQILHLQIPDPLFKAIEQVAAAQNTDAASVATAALQERFHTIGDPPHHGMSRVPGCLEELFGAIDLGHPTGLENEAIDADLIKDYSRGLPDR
jgi:hypothetical protein